MSPRNILHGARTAVAMLFGAAAALAAQPAFAGACDGIAHCFDTGAFTSEVVQVVTARHDSPTAYHTVRLTVRFRNVSKEPLILAYRVGSGVMIDNNGNQYGYHNNRRVPSGIGVVQPGSADTQFQLAPGEARNATFESVMQYSPARTVLGNAYNYDLVIEQLAVIGGQQVRTVRSHAIGFAGLRSTTAGPNVAAGTPSSPATVVTTTPVHTSPSTPTVPAPVPAPAPGTPAPAPAPAPATPAPVAQCAVPPNMCSTAGPFIAEVAQVAVAKQAGQTAYQTVRVTLRIRNVSQQPLALAYKMGSTVVIDNNNNRYNYYTNRKVPQGMGVVTPHQADAQFRLAPGQSRNATFEAMIQYSPKHVVLGNAYNFDLVLEQLEALSPTQVRSVREYALNYTNLTQGSSPAPASAELPAGVAEGADTVQKAVDLFKSLTKGR